MTLFNNSLISKEEYDCPFCNEIHEVQIRKRETQALVKDEVVEYDEVYYQCDIQDEEFVPAKILDDNLLKARDSYRIRYGLLTSEQIKEIRQFYNLNQKEFSNILGWGDITIQRYEKKSIQDETYDNIMRMFFNNPTFALETLDKHKNCFDDIRYKEVKEVIKVRIKQRGNIFLKKQEILNSYIEYDEENDLNGYKILDIDKVANVMSYFAHYANRLYKVKLMKMLWYNDSVFFKRYGKSMTGLVYQHLPLGAVPIGYNEIVYMPTIKIVEELICDDIAYKITPASDISISAFDFNELKVLEEITTRFKDITGSELSVYMHKEKAYIETENIQIIPYSLAKEVYDFS